MGIWGEVNYPGQLFRAAPNLFGWFGRHVVPYVLIRSEVGDALEACQVAGGRLQQRHDRLPHGIRADSGPRSRRRARGGSAESPTDAHAR